MTCGYIIKSEEGNCKNLTLISTGVNVIFSVISKNRTSLHTGAIKIKSTLYNFLQRYRFKIYLNN